MTFNKIPFSGGCVRIRCAAGSAPPSFYRFIHNPPSSMCEFVYMIEEQQPLAISQQHKKNIFIAKIHSITNCVVCECRTSSCCRHRFDYPDKKKKQKYILCRKCTHSKMSRKTSGPSAKKAVNGKMNDICVWAQYWGHTIFVAWMEFWQCFVQHRGEGIDTSPQNSLLLLKICKIFSITRLCWIIQVHRIPLVNQVYVKGDCCTLFRFE